MTPPGSRNAALMTAAMTVPWLAAAVLWGLLQPGTLMGNPLVLLVMVSLLVVAQANQLNIELRRHTFTVNTAEFAFVLALFLLPPFGVLAVRMVGAAALPLMRRMVRRNDLVNAGVASLEAAVALTVIHHLGERPIADPMSWLVVLAAVLAADLAAAAMVVLAISAAQERLGWRGTVGLLVPTLTLGAFNTVVGLLTLLVADVSYWALLLLLAVLGAVIAVYRAYNRFVRQHRSLGQLYEFSRLVEGARTDLSGLHKALQHLRETFNATTVALCVEPGSVQERLALRADESGVAVVPPPAADDPLRELLSNSREGRLFSRRDSDRTVRAALEARGINEMLAMPLRVGSGLIGHLEVRDRQGSVTSFAQDDVGLLRNAATHLTAALENQQLVDRLRHDAHHDRLTGLPNREWFTMAVDEAIAAIRDNPARRSRNLGESGADTLVAVYLLDLDSFKDVNDSLGHDYGDQLLITVGDRLREHVGPTAMVARMGADEFAVLRSVDDLAMAEKQAAALYEMLAEPYLLAGLSVHVGSCVGVAVAPDHAMDAGTLLQRADVALYGAKSRGRSVATYLSTMEQASVHRLQLVTQLREALDAGQVTVRYQPKIAMATRELVGVEALVRWEHPQYGTVVPDDFVPLAERTGLIGPLTMHVIGAALRQCREWLDRDLRIGVAVNLSVRNLLDLDFPDKVEELRSEIGIPPDLLAFEITESSVMSDPKRSMPVLHRLHELGIGLSIDDFGTGYSSLAYLRRLPVDEVKIDKVFVLGMGTDLGDLAIVRAIIELGHSLGLRVVAEGVEDELARDLLEGMDCDVAQGFLVSRALQAERLDAWFTARTVTRPGQPGVRGRRLLVTG